MLSDRRWVRHLAGALVEARGIDEIVADIAPELLGGCDRSGRDAGIRDDRKCALTRDDSVERWEQTSSYCPTTMGQRSGGIGCLTGIIEGWAKFVARGRGRSA